MNATLPGIGASLQLKPSQFSLAAIHHSPESAGLKVFIVSQDTRLSSSLLDCIAKIKQAGPCRVVNSFIALQALQCDAAAIIIVDANMPDVELFASISHMLSHHIIIIAGNRSQSMVAGLPENVFAFIDVPVALGDIFTAISQSILYLGGHISPVLISRQFVFVKSEYKLVRVNIAEILFVEGMKDYVKIWYTGKRSPLTTLQNLKEFEAKLPEDHFIRVHKSYIVALDHVDCITRNEIVIGGHCIPVGNAYRKGVNSFINLFS